MIEFNGKYTTAKVMIDDVEPTCASQIVEFINSDAFTNPIAIMPDTHAGKGAVIGFTMEMGDKVIPNVIGVDIGCGMLAGNLGKNLFASVSKEDLDKAIRKAVPVGTNIRGSISQTFDENLFYSRCNRGISRLRQEYIKRQNFMDLKRKCESVDIIDMDMITLIYENCFEGCSRAIPDDVISCLERIN